jgi:hypothetical protein
MKATRYYRIEDGMLCVYDTAYANTSKSVSVVKPTDMAWYRNHFRMVKLAGDVCPEEWM